MKTRPRPRTGSKLSPARIRAVDRAAQALRLRAEGLSFAAIAARLNYNSRQSAHAAVTSALIATIAEPAEHARALDLERLDALWSVAFRKARAGNIDAINACVRIQARRAALLGLDQPVKVAAKIEHESSSGVLVTPGMLSEDAWSKLAAEHAIDLAAREEAAGPKH